MTSLTQPDTIPYDAAVTEVRDLFTRAERDLWRIAEIVAHLEPKHGEGTLKQFAKDIDRKYRIVYDYRATYLAWANCKRLQTLPLTVALQLNDHPDKERIVLEKPNLSFREAQKIMEQYADKKKPKPAKEKEHVARDRALRAYDRRKAAGESLTREAIGQEAGVSDGIAGQAIAMRQAEEKQAEEKVVLSKSKQAQYDAALKAEQRRLELVFETRVLAEVKKRMDTVVIPAWLKNFEQLLSAIKYRKGVMKHEEYRKIMRCLHTDFIQHLNPPQATLDAFNEAFSIFKHYELALCNERERPTDDLRKNLTPEDLMANVRAYDARKKAERDARKAAKTTAH
jgi:hypothetical protein